MPVSFRSELAEFDYNHALRQVDNLFDLRLCLSKYTLILSLVNSLIPCTTGACIKIR